MGVRQRKSAGRASVIGADAVATQLFRNRSCEGPGSSYSFRNLGAERQYSGRIFGVGPRRQGVRKGPAKRREAQDAAGGQELQAGSKGEAATANVGVDEPPLGRWRSESSARAAPPSPSRDPRAAKASKGLFLNTCVRGRTAGGLCKSCRYTEGLSE